MSIKLRTVQDKGSKYQTTLSDFQQHEKICFHIILYYRFFHLNEQTSSS